MTPKACALYDTIKLKKLRGDCMHLDCIECSKELAELIENGWIELFDYHPGHGIKPTCVIKLLR